MYQLIYDPRGQLVKVGCYADLVVAEPRYPEKIVLASLGGDDSSVKAIAAAIVEHRELEMVGEEGGEKLFSRVTSEGRHRVLMSKTPEGHVHALVASRRVLPGEGDVVLCWDGDPAGALGRWLLSSTDLPLLPEWYPRLWAAAEGREMIQSLTVHASGKVAVSAFRVVAAEPDRWQELIGELVMQGELAIPDAGGESPTLDAEKLNDYLVGWGPHLAARAQARHKPVYETGSPRHPAIAGLARPLFEPQADVVEGLARVLEHQSAAMCIGEMGVGKTTCGAAVAYRLYAGRQGYRVLVVCPKHLLAKWPREVRTIIPEAKTTVLRSGGDVAALWPLRHTRPEGSEWYFVARDTAKLGWFWKCAAAWKDPVVKTVPRGKDEPPDVKELRPGGWRCPDCWTIQADKEGMPWKRDAMEAQTASNRRCVSCGSPLWAADRKRTRRCAPAWFVHRHLRGFFNLLVADEVHEMKGGDTAQGIALGTLASACSKILLLTGTLLGGYARDAYYLMWRAFPQGMLAEDLEYRKPSLWIDRYGVVDRIFRESGASVELNKSSRGSKGERTIVREQPGVSPLVFSRHLLDRCAFLDLADVAPWLPSYMEIPDPVEMGEDLQRAYKALEGDLLAAVRQQLATGSRRLLGAYLQTLMGYCDRPWDWPPVVDPLTGAVVAAPTPLPEDEIRPKERRLIERVREEVSRGRRVAVYVMFTGKHDLLGRLSRLLQDHGYRTAVLRRDTVPVEGREAWIDDQVKRGAQVLLCHPKLVETGLDLLAFPSIEWYQTGYSLYVLRQASRRSFRIGQTEPVEVRFLSYAGTMQSAALLLMSKKLDAAQALEGRLSAEGLRALAGGGDSTLALARMLCDGMGELRTAEAAWRTAATAPVPVRREDGLVRQTLSDLMANVRVLDRPQRLGRIRVGAGQVVLDFAV